jgi:hypothetical protein
LSLQVCAVVGSGREGGRPISKSTLFKHFRNEMKNGQSMLRALVMGRYRDALHDGAPWAVQMGMRSLFRWDIASAPLPHLEVPGEKGRPSIQVSFLRPDPRMIAAADEEDVVVEPKPVYNPAPPGTKLLPAPDPNQRPMPDLSRKRHWME